MLINFSMMPNEKHTQTLWTRGFESNTWVSFHQEHSFCLWHRLASASSCVSFPFLVSSSTGKRVLQTYWLALWDPRKETPRCFSVLWHLQLWDGGLLGGYIDGWLFWSSLTLERRKDDSLGDTSQDQREQRW